MPDTPLHGSFDDVLALASAELRPVCQALHQAILALHPHCTQVAWPRQKIASYGVGPHKMSEHYAYIAVQPRHINLGFYRGAMLDDPAGLLEGTGKGLRHIKLRSVEQAVQPAVIALLRQAIAERRQAAPSP
ncbi:DUF1801 domain-containing protein [Ideonella sp. BN130291]|uniref:DUF1801 domain-containing protein n=1 Tax=Ideonella sp. BN130291 TaxID=3112940 RepID=UPI002E2560DD|nr:DUF1801 domain-containing protein [Ideonella sp. BN130291]